MINIHKQIWVVKGVEREDDLSYMCQYAEDKKGEVLSNVAKMQSTGRGWARKGMQNIYKLKENPKNSYDYLKDEKGSCIVDYVKPAQDGEEFIYDNTPIDGFYIGSSVARWSTSNKLFRVKDPRGFTVEVPTDNIATLLHHTTVKNGFVQEDCVWGREGNNHILLPVNSEPYLLTLDQMDTLANKLISVKDLKVGDWVKMFEDETEYYYAGKVKATWKVRGYSYTTSWRFSSYGNREDYQYSDWVEVEDDKWVDLFLRKYEYSTTNGKKYLVGTFSKPKIVEVVKNDKMSLDVDSLSWYCPDRVKNKTDVYNRFSGMEQELVSLKEKK